ncbi:pentatricopeptide repeat-containing protein At4g21190 isoform X2 [Solanum stenotomum]|uniref:pentatricopeptide repeat-containing protein At4g21190 isoform X1 n=1 Tax=Solanum stenotomum TaxID=172797 RepID=UPI0020D07933|nr:pentatricopeptide repeat-containing protein At4g21190 isoform X1 [Solanum stenotomum]XP_049378961.1 pentatricopeptide repeat-containing protein At4g21190 isoform X2 [Solanum stenotomum]XP_049378962.1 pentatricopeptide repeat-containing protein At4g21190 isoform X2 [Solanum stenotomum]
MLCLRYSPVIFTTRRQQTIQLPKNYNRNVVVCEAKGPRPRYPRVWKTKKKIGTISKSLKLVECIKGLSNVKEEVYGALDSFIAWELEFPLITVKKALKILENEKEWKRIIQVTKWMLSKGQGRTMGSYFALLNALAEDGRLEEAEELWLKLFSQNLESMPRIFFQKMIAIYYHKEMNEKMFEIFADMEELGIRPTVPVVTMVGNVFQKLGMLDKYQKLKKKYPPPKWEYRYIKGKRVKIRIKDLDKSQDHDVESKSEEVDESEFNKNSQDQADEVDEDYVEQIKDVEECEPGEISIVSSETRESSMST